MTTQQSRPGGTTQAANTAVDTLILDGSRTARTASTGMNPTLEAALELLAHGIAPIPVRMDGSKRPALSSWKQYQERLPTEAEVLAWFADDAAGLGLLTGPISGNLIMGEVEGRGMAELPTIRAYAEACGQLDLWNRATTAWLEQSPSGGLHYFYRSTEEPPGNQKLARRPATAEELAENPADKVKVLTETRATGGFAVVAPTNGKGHETGQPWVNLLGGPASIPTLTPEEISDFHRMLSIINSMPAPAAPSPPAGPGIFTRQTADSNGQSGTFDGVSPLDDYEAKTSWPEILEPEGWTLVWTDHACTSYWRRPGKTSGQASATTGHSHDRDRLYVFSTSTDLPTETPMTKQFVYAALHHGGDMSKAASALRKKGYGTPQQDTRPAKAASEATTPTDTGNAGERHTAARTAGPAATLSTVEGTADQQHRGQARMAYRLAEKYNSKLMYVRGIGWHVWNGRNWAEDEKDYATNAVLETLRRALADSIGGDKELREDVRKCEQAAGINGVLNIAAALPALRASTDELDADPSLFNCWNGTLDLRTRQLRPHDPADRITHIARGAYDPNAVRTSWEGFLSEILPDPEERAYTQRVFGLAAHGRVREHLFPVLTGSGSNGKGTAYGAIVNALGDYAVIINPELLMAAGHGSGGPEMMVLRGARLVIGSETEEGRKLDAALMKRLTGGDQLTARPLYQPPVTWTPSHQLVYVTNHLPKVKGNDPAVWRRIRVIPFDVVVPDEQKDETLPERLELAADAVLTWLVEGWFQYEDMRGMNEPETVLRATDAYQTESDALKRFIESECETGPYIHVPARELYNAWSAWAVTDGADALNERAFAKELDRLGYERRRTTAGNVRAGIGLAQEDTEKQGPM